MTRRKTRLLVLISGNGSNLQAILDACQSGELDAEVVAVISNRAEAYGLERARNADVPARTLKKSKDCSREEYDRLLVEAVSVYQPDWILLAGWMRLLTMEFLGRFPGHVINIHPALPGTFPGTHAIERAWEAFQKGEIDHTGVMTHLVPDEGVDSGPVLGSCVVPILAGDTQESLEERIHRVEHQLYVDTIRDLIRDTVNV